MGSYCSSTVLLRIILALSVIVSVVAAAPSKPSHPTSRRSLIEGFTLPLIHRDSLLSPFHRHNTTQILLNKEAFQRGLSRARYRFGKKLTIQTAGSVVFPDMGEYLLKLSLGTPPLDVYGIADTGSDLFWTQCLPCDQCYNQTKPKFDPAASSTYAKLNCMSEQCHLLDTVTCSGTPTSNNKWCNYTYGYASNSLTKGFLATDTITLSTATGMNAEVSLPKIVFGCGHNNTGGFNVNEMGIVGLGRGPLSFISQMTPHLGGRKMFSHCLVPFHTDPNTSSKISFGVGSEVTGTDVVSTPLVITDQHHDPTYYFVTLNGMSVGNVYVPFSNQTTTVSKGNMFLDSGTPPTIVPRDFYVRLESEVKTAVPPELTPITDPTLGDQLCYGEGVQMKGPILTAHFDGNGDVQLKQKSIFIEAKPGVFCFALVPTDSDGGIFGNFAQTDYLIGFDIDQRTISFKPTDCTKYTKII